MQRMIPATNVPLRELGDTEAAVREARLALRLARRTGSVERETDVLSSLGLALVFAGRTDEQAAVQCR